MTESGRRNVEPVAIVGIGCRFPGGANDPDTFWSLLMQQRSGIRDVPPNRWNLDRYHHPDPAVAGATVMRRGGFIDDLDSFDAAFWGISPREALRMDPQQRWLLEVAWEAIEDAGTAPLRLRGRRVGVFVGISGNDYGGLQLRSAEDVDAYTNSGSTPSIASNRVSYMLDLRGPSVSIDTACSSALVSVAAACENIWAGHCEAALAGGVNSLISPNTSVGFSKASMISPTGDCFAFDARANGFVRAEGAALVYLKPLSAAVGDGDRVYALIRSVVVNQDGHTSSMTVPGLDGQTAMLEDAYRQAGVDPARVAYVEAHGTGTPVGDPIEAAALGRVVGRGRPKGSTCLIGSVKTNIGHLESASGIAGLVKAALILRHRTIPATVNHERPNPNIPFDDLHLTVAAANQALAAAAGEPPVVGVNSFGFGGTNAHAVLEAAQQPDPAAPTWPPEASNRPCLLPISARDESALRAYVKEFRSLLADSTIDVRDLCTAAGDRKEHHAQRLVISGRTRAELRRRAARWLCDGAAEGVSFGRSGSPAAPVFVFAGQGPQWWGMGRQLFDREPVFRETMLAVDAAIQKVADWSVLAEMLRPQSESRIEHTDVGQPAIFALQVALCALWNTWGIRPSKAIGHSVGEVAAAYCAGVYSLDDAARIITTRARLQHRGFGGGRMLVVALSEDEVKSAIGAGRGVELAAINSPRLMTLAGDVEPLTEIERQLQPAGVFTRWLRGHYAFHTAQMDPIRDEMLDALADIRPAGTRIPLVSTVTGRTIEGKLLDAAYWWQNIRKAVRFGPAVTCLIDDGDRTFLEVSAHPVLESAMKECLAEREQQGNVVHSLRREADESDEIASSLAALHVAGAEIDWRAVNQGSGRIVRLPRYPWRRESFWIESPESARIRLAPVAHPLLGQRIESAVPTWQTTLDLPRLSYLRDHQIWDSVLFPAAAYSEIGLALGRVVFPEEPPAVENLDIVKALFIADGQAPVLQTAFNPEDRSFAVYSSAQGVDPWEVHARGTLARPSAGAATPLDLESVRNSLEQRLDHAAYCRELDNRGFHFGPRFRQVRNLWRRAGEVLIEIEPPPDIAGQSGYVFHPAVLDACFHALIGFPTGKGPDSRPPLVLPQSVRRLRVYGSPPGRLWTRALNASFDGTSLEADLFVYDDRGNRVADILGFRTQAVEQKAPPSPLEDCYYRFTWEPRRLSGSGVHGSCRFAASADIVGAVRAALPGLEARHGLDEYHRRFVPDAEATVALLAQKALVDLGWWPQQGDRITAETLIDLLEIDPDYGRVATRLLRTLARHGVLHAAGDDAWEVSRVPDGTGAVDAVERLAREYPAWADEIDLYRRTGLNLGAILAGELDPLKLLFPGGSHQSIEQFYSRALGFPSHLEAMRLTIERAIASLPRGRTLRVLEVGGGTGVLTHCALPILPAHRTEYLFTDIGGGFTAAARKRFADCRFINFHVFDIENDPEPQGIPAGHFDLILAGDVVHATADLRVSLRNLRRCLAPGGLLMLLELTRPDFVRDDATFGVLKGYSCFTDRDVRPYSALVLPGQWRRLMTECGFEDVASVDCFSDPDLSEHAIVVGSAPAPTEVQPAANDPRGSRYVIFADAGGVASALARGLRDAGHSTVLVYPGDELSTDGGCITIRPDAEDDIANAIAGECAGVVHCWSLDRPDASAMTLDQLGTSQSLGLLSAYQLIRALADRGTPAWFLTRAAQQVSEGDLVEGLASAPLSGLLRVANNEHRCRFFNIDLDGTAPADVAPQLADEITLPSDGEFEVAYRDGVRYVPRLQRVQPAELPLRTFNAVSSGGRALPFQVETHSPGILSNLALHETERFAPGPDEVEVRVLAAGINFRDVMKALGTHPGHPVDLLWFGDDLSGVVERVGDQVTAFRPGDEVAGMAPYAIRSYARTDARILFRKPAHLSFAEAATIPTVFLTAHYAINHLARMQAGESILIHAGTGGVGQAAIQVAKHLGLKIFATAGTVEKRRLLTGMGVDRVMSSRTLEFADEVMDATGGRGVDAVLNSLAGDFIPKSLSILAPFGRFLEIGKVDVYRNTKIGLQPLRNNISYFVIDLTQHLRDRREFVVQMFREIAAGFAAGYYQPVPVNAFPIAAVADAFRFMAQGKHVGKNVLTFDDAEIPVAFSTDSRQRFRTDATYLVTGGAGGFGLEVARWIASHGGRHIALMSRSGPRDEDSIATIERLRSDGVIVRDLRGDVSSAADVAHVVATIAKELPPLKGVFHGAMVLDDGLIAELDAERVRAALEPKMSGAWNLHLATSGVPLDHFVGFSSFSSVVGMIRQSNYNAGNAFLDALARYRRAHGLPALTVNWGVILGAGYVERTRDTAEVLARAGVRAFRTGEAIGVLDELLVRDGSQVGAARVDWNAVLKLSPLVAASRVYATVARDTHAAEAGGSLISQLRAAAADEQEQLLQEFITEQVAGVFGTAEDRVDRAARLTDLGLDSLMTLELTIRVERELGIRVPVGALMSGPTIAELARSVRELLAPVLAAADSAAGEWTESAQHPGATPDVFDHILMIKSGTDLPVFCFHPVGGGVGIYAALASHVPGDLPLHGVESRVVQGGATEYGSLPEMVDAYVEAVRLMHPGPYRLLGFSLGGYLAARVAAVLENLGAIVEFVGVIDWDARQKVTPAAQREGLVRLSVASYRFLQQEMGILKPRAEARLRDEISALVDRIAVGAAGGGDAFFHWVVEQQLTTSPALEDLARQYLVRFEQHCRLLTHELPRPRFGAPLIVWRAREGFGSSLESWDRGGGLDREHVFDGDHNALMRPAALERVADQLMDFMNAVSRVRPVDGTGAAQPV